jgi:hypothetical protein
MVKEGEIGVKSEDKKEGDYFRPEMHPCNLPEANKKRIDYQLFIQG